jgi:ribokinase
MANIYSIGSLNMDIVLHVANLPKPGETLHSFSRKHLPGGKGANQAVAAARCGGSVAMIGAVGTDTYGDALLEALQADHIDTGDILRKEGDSGTAFITVDAHAENHIVLSAGANGLMLPEDIPDRIQSAAIVLLQNEIPWHVNRHVLEIAQERNVPVLLNAAPAMLLEEDAFPLIQILAVNETELETMSGLPASTRDEVLIAAESLISKGVRNILVTLGGDGSLWIAPGGEALWTPAFRVQPVDTTAAGDTFIGAFAVEYANGSPVTEALRFASAAAAIAVTREGAQSSVPARDEVLRLTMSAN